MHDSMDGLVAFPAMDWIVGLAVLFSVGFLAVWLASVRLRQWVERPKFGFQAALESYDLARRGESTLKKGEDLR